MQQTIAPSLGLGLATALLTLGTVGCDEGAAGVGEACETAQDCDGKLVCAKVATDSSERVCADQADTREDPNCTPEYVGMICGVVLKSSSEPDAG
ncbi:MAG: hypothetical protein OXU20_29110 [Myxococcales bacterium]|nr:hypothetical protein [Myxococcales bacterium]MDD9971470.1 hypothetical protein [Myxococcales bacterium]